MSMVRGQVIWSAIEAEIVAVESGEQSCQCGQQVVRRGDGVVKVAMEMQVDFLAGFDLRLAAARRARPSCRTPAPDVGVEVSLGTVIMVRRPLDALQTHGSSPMERVTVLPSPECGGAWCGGYQNQFAPPLTETSDLSEDRALAWRRGSPQQSFVISFGQLEFFRGWTEYRATMIGS